MDNKIKQFILWKDDLTKSPFNVCINLIDKDRPKVEYEKNGKHYTIDQVYDFWEKNILDKV